MLLLGHHSVVGNGVYGGHAPLSRHLSPPVLGTVYATYRQNVGTPRDLANPRYLQLKKELLNTLQSNPGVIYAAAHDFSLQVTPLLGNYHIVSGSFAKSQHVGAQGPSLYSESAVGYTTLEYFADGTVKTHVFTFGGQGQAARDAYAATLFHSACTDGGDQKAPANPFVTTCPGAPKTVAEVKPEPASAKPDAPFQATTTVVPGPEYRPTASKRFFIGDTYRSA